LYNPAGKPGKCFKFHKFWIGPFQVTATLSELNYEIVIVSHKKHVVHINRLNLAYNTDIWKPKPSPEVNSKPATRPNKRERQRVTQPFEPEEDEVRIGPFPLLRQGRESTTSNPGLLRIYPQILRTLYKLHQNRLVRNTDIPVTSSLQRVDPGENYILLG